MFHLTRQLVHQAGQSDGHPIVHIQLDRVTHYLGPEADLLSPVLLGVLHLVIIVVILILLLIVILLLSVRISWNKMRYKKRVLLGAWQQ